LRLKSAKRHPYLRSDLNCREGNTMAELSQTHLLGTITERKDHAPDLWTVKIRPEAPIPFKPGQYVSLGVKSGDKVIERPYSVVSAPHEPEIELFFELVPHGELTPRLHELQVGAQVLLRKKAKGMFLLDARPERQHFMVTTVTGIAPCVSMVRHLDREIREGRLQIESRLFLMQGASRSWELAYREELAAMAARHSKWLKYVPTVSRPWEDPKWTGEVGRCEDLFRKYLDDGFDPRSTTAYLCGHPGMIENGKGILTRRGFERDDVHVEVYWIPPKEPAQKLAVAR
jgi:ferredoxin--NADP+ reductase